MNVLAEREANGRFLPGFTPNPSGRPKGAGAIRELARQYVPAALQKIAELVSSPDPRVALAASQEILNRVFGKPLQSVDNEIRKFDMAQLYLAASKIANGITPAIVDVTPPPDDEPAVVTDDNSTTDDPW
jgi:hypothetical protein